jgi:short-subunit dehydrogenase
MPLDVFETHVQTNYLGAVRAVKAALPQLKEKNGRIINISSVAGISTIPFLGAYSASKYALEGFSDALRMEMHGEDVEVVIVEPGPVKTGFNQRGANALEKYMPESSYTEHYRKRIENTGDGVTPEKAAEKIIRAVESDSPNARYTVTWQAYIISKIKPFTPTRLYDKLARKL